jgi:acyl-CoA synthetase (AMP-forming)/AMP-acid ligase II
MLAAQFVDQDRSIDRDGRVLIARPLWNADAKWMQVCHHLHGGTVFLQPQFNAGILLETIERERITATLLTTTMMQAVLDHPDFEWRDLSSLRTVYYCAGPMATQLLRRAFVGFGPILFQSPADMAAGPGAALFEDGHKGETRAVRRSAPRRPRWLN